MANWQSLYEKLAIAEVESHNRSDAGCFEVFNSMTLWVGDHSEAISPWLELIPSELGLCIVKSAFAILLSVRLIKQHHRENCTNTLIECENARG